jgi:hypothetical protein
MVDVGSRSVTYKTSTTLLRNPSGTSLKAPPPKYMFGVGIICGTELHPGPITTNKTIPTQPDKKLSARLIPPTLPALNPMRSTISQPSLLH